MITCAEYNILSHSLTTVVFALLNVNREVINAIYSL